VQVLIIVCFVCIINGDKIFRGSWDPLTNLTPPHFCASPKSGISIAVCRDLFVFIGSR